MSVEQTGPSAPPSDLRFGQVVLDTLPASLAVLDRQGVILLVNQAWTRFASETAAPTGAGLQVGANYLEAARNATGPYAGEAQAACQGINAVLTGASPGYASKFPGPASKPMRWYLLQVTPLAIPAGAVLVSHQDITAQKSLEFQFRQAQKMEAIGRLAGGAAHDFNNLLTIILGYSDMLLSSSLLDESTRDFLAEIKKAGERAAVLTRQLLAFSRKQILDPAVLDLNQVVADCEKMLKRLLGEDVEFVTRLAPAPALVKADAGQLEQVLMNLAINARDAMPQGGRLTLETAALRLEAADASLHPGVNPGPYVTLTVSDTGNSLEGAAQARLFEPAYTANEAGPAAGLGLAMVAGFVQDGGGHITVQSQPGRGTTFTLHLPAIEPEPGPAAGSGDETTPPSGWETILLVEDDDGVRTLARQILQNCGYTVLDTARGADALVLAQNHAGPIHLLIADVVLPDLGGTRLAGQVAALQPDLKTLFISGHADDTLRHHGVRPAETNFLSKPFTPETLPAKVRQILDRWP